MEHGFFRNRPDVRQTRDVAPELNAVTEAIIGACIEVHRVLGPGLQESMYEIAVCRELELRRIPFQRQAPLAIEYKGVTLGQGRIDLLVAEKVIVELKAVEVLSEVHRCQLITYLTVSRLEVGLLINFNVPRLIDGIKRVVRTHSS